MAQQSMSLKVLIFPISLAVAVAVAIFFIKPAFSEIMSVKSSLAEKNTQLENLKNQNQRLQSLKSKWESLAEEKNLVATALPEAENVDSYVSELTSKASRSGILLSGIQASQKGGSVSAETTPSYICGAGPDGGVSQASASSSPAQAAGAAQPAGMPSSSDIAGAGGSNSCLNKVGISLKAAGSWEQILDFFKYLEDMNRMSNIDSVSLSAGTQSGQTSSDLLTADISATAFFKAKDQSGNAILAGSLADQQNFNQKAMEKLKEVIYSPYDVPAVSPNGERNIFK